MTNWNVISACRNRTMGFAIILIMLYHLGYADILNIGVDIFLLLSGMGGAYSLKKNNDIMLFYKKRIVRILPEFLMVSIPVSLIYMLIDHKSVLETIVMASGLSVFFNHSFAFWFIPLILICYLITPLLFHILSKSTKSKILMLVSLCMLCYILAFFTDKAFIVFIRIPVFVMGMLISPSIAECSSINKTKFIMMSLISIIGIAISQYLINTGCEWSYVFISYTIYILPLTLCLSTILNSIKFRFLPYLGAITLELYLLHESLCIRFANLVLHEVSGFAKLLMCTILSVALAIMLSKVLQSINDKTVQKLWN